MISETATITGDAFLMRHSLVILLFIITGCHAAAKHGAAVPTTMPNEAIGVTVTKGDFIVVGKQDKGIAVYLTIDRRERTCLIEVQNATDDRIAILDSFTDTSLYRGVGFDSSAAAPATQTSVPRRAGMLQVFPSQVLRGSLSFPDSAVQQHLHFRLYFGDPGLSRWIDIETPEFDISR